MAVELNRVSKDPTLSLFYYFEKEEQLENISNILYAFTENTTSMMKLNDTEFKPARIYLTTVLHKGAHDCELIVELHNEKEKLFVCFGLKRKKETFSSEIAFPLKESPLEKMLYGFPNMLYYKTSTKSHVFFCAAPDNIYVGDNFPRVLDHAKAKYKEIFEPNAFDIFNNLFTHNDYKRKVIPAVEGGQFLKYTRTINEGFLTKDGSYMECELIDENTPTTAMSEYALTPLNANYYERGLITIVTFLHFLIIVLVGGILFPWFQCYGIGADSANLKYWWGVFIVIHLLFPLISLILLSVGLRGTKKKYNKAVRQRRLAATFGLYFLILFFSNAIGMKIMFPSCPLYDKVFTGKNENFHLLINTLFNPMWNTTGVENSRYLHSK